MGVTTEAIAALKRGGVIAYPTETVYGLGADVHNEAAVQKVYGLKGREETKSLSIAVRKEQISEYAVISTRAQELIDQFLPGPLTLVLPKTEKVPSWITTNKFVGIRVPKQDTMQQILEEFGPITSTSANLSGQAAAKSVEEIPEAIRNHVDFVLNEGTIASDGASTVVKVDADENETLLRQGALQLNKEEQLREGE